MNFFLIQTIIFFRVDGVCTVDCFNMILLKMKYCTKIKRGRWEEMINAIVSCLCLTLNIRVSLLS